MLAGIVALQAPVARAETWRVEPSIGIEETLTNNVNLTPSPQAQGDLVTQLTPALTINEAGARTRLTGTIAAPILLYVRTGAENNTVLPAVNLTGTVEAVDKFFYVDGAVNVLQQYFTPFGPTPPSLATVTQNRYTAESYRVSPYIKGVAAGNIQYQLRDDNVWTNLYNAPITGSGASGSYTNALAGTISRRPTPFGWGVDYDRTDVRFTSQPAELTQLGRLRLLHIVDPQLELSASGGYEVNDYPFAKYRDAIYGLGLTWRPSELTSVTAKWEHRFFGASYLFDFTHRTPLSLLNVHASRDVTSYPAQLAQLPAGANVVGLLNQLFLTRIPDPVQRLQFIQQFIQDRGLPLFLSSPVNFYTQQNYLLEQASATFGLIGARNTVFFSANYARSQPITGAGAPLPGLPDLANNNTQKGGGIVWTTSLTPSLLFIANASLLHTVANAPQTGYTNQGSVTATLTSPLSANTSLHAGARYQVVHSDISNDYTEAAVYMGLTHTFH